MAVAVSMTPFAQAQCPNTCPFPAPASDVPFFAPPNGEVPLSQFTSGDGTNDVVLQVRPEILQWIATNGGTIQVFDENGSPVPVLNQDNVSGEIECLPPAGVGVVATSALLKNHFLGTDQAIVTHWDSSLNGGRGGHLPDATDGIGAHRYPSSLSQSPDIYNADPAHRDDSIILDPQILADPEDAMYWFKTQDYALFSDGSETIANPEPASLHRPGYERYIGENWSLRSVSDLALIRMSDTSRHCTGLPVAHRNPTPAFAAPGTVPETQRLQSGLPIFQVVHAYIVEYEHPGTSGGAEDSLATFLIPPFWTEAQQNAYPVAFHAFYDIHDNTLGTGVGLLKDIGRLYLNHGEQAVGILSNGGGSTCSLTQQQSIYRNVAKLFDDASDPLALGLGIDRKSVVVTGGSRGATAGLALSSSPYADAYTFEADYVLASNPTTQPGDGIDNHQNPTYPLIQANGSIATGYAGGWKPGFVGAGGLTGEELALQTLYGSTDFVAVDANLANGSQAFIDELDAKRTRVYLRLGTHDTTHPFEHMTEYHEDLLSAGVRTRFEIGYRLGHGFATNACPTFYDLLERVATSQSPPASEEGTYHYRPDTVAEEHAYVGQQFDPVRAPVIVEAALNPALDQTFTINVSAPPGTRYEIQLLSLVDSSWFPSGAITPAPGEWFIPWFIGATPFTTTPGVEMTSTTHQVSVPSGFGFEGVWHLGLVYTYLTEPAAWTVGESSVPPDGPSAPSQFWFDLFDAGAVSYFGDLYGFFNSAVPLNHTEPVNGLLWVDPNNREAGNRTGGLSTDLEVALNP